MDPRTTIARLIGEAELMLGDRSWEPTPADRALAARAAADLAEAVGPPDIQEALAPIDRLECLRTALAVLAVAIARVHGHLAWFLSAASTALAPVLHWRALPADDGRSFGTLLPDPGQYADAERAVRRLQDALARIATAEAELGTVPEAVPPLAGVDVPGVPLSSRSA